MSDEIKPFLKYTFLGHFVIAVIFGVSLTFFPMAFADFINWPTEDLYFTRLTGALMLGFGMGSILAFRETSWEKVKLIVICEVSWLVIGVGIQIYGIIAVVSNIMSWLNLVLLLGLVGVFGWSYFQQQK